VQDLPKDEEELRIIWEGDTQDDCAEACQDLRDAGIQYEVSQLLKSLSGRMRAHWQFKIAVLASEYDHARRVLGLEGELAEVESDGAEMQAAIELPAEDVQSVEGAAESKLYLKKWSRDEACVEVWSHKDAGTSLIVLLSLKENLIRFREDHLADGTRKFFVFPVDESRAREIVREVMDGTPPS